MAFNNFVFDKNIFEWWFAGQPTGQPVLKTVEQWCKDEKADLCFNLGEFNMPKTGKYEKLSICEVIAQGRRISYGYGDRTDLLYINDKNACRGYSYGVRNGAVYLNRPKGGKRSRNGIGMTTSGNLVVSQSNNATEKDLCTNINKYVKGKGQTISTFLMEDGGGSTCEYSALSRLKFAPEGGRECATVLCIRVKRPISITHPIYAGCPKDISTEYVQMILGGIAADRDAQTLTKNRILAAQIALGFPKGMQTGVADYYTLKKMGFLIAY